MAISSQFERPVLNYLSLGEPVQQTGLRVPENVWFEDDRHGGSICYAQGGWSPRKSRAGEERLLTEFMSLAHLSQTKVVAFAKKYGVLELCRHDLPASHIPRRMWADLAEDETSACWPVRHLGTGGVTREKLSTWIRLATQAEATHRIAGLLTDYKSVPEENWTSIRGLLPQGMVNTPGELRSQGFEPREFTEAQQQRVLMMALQRWLDLGDVGFRVSWEKGSPSFTYGGTGLAGAIAIQLGLTCTRTFGFLICSNAKCSLPYSAKRGPKPGEANYCLECRGGPIPNRVRQQRHRAKKASQSSSRST